MAKKHVRLVKMHFDYKIVDFQLTQEHPTVWVGTNSHKHVHDAKQKSHKNETAASLAVVSFSDRAISGGANPFVEGT